MLNKIRRGLKIIRIVSRYGLSRHIISKKLPILYMISYLNPYSYSHSQQNRANNMRKGLEQLGPIFVKFGQLLSVRQDMLPADIISQLSLLQDNVTPFDSMIAQQIIEHTFKQPISSLFSSFQTKPLAAASIAQVHAATLPSGEEVIIKVLRPHIKKIIQQDISLMYIVARTIERYFKNGHRTRAIELVAEFEHTILNELDLIREASSASLLRRNFENSHMMYVPKIYWKFAKPNIMVMERIYGIRISDIATLKKNNVDLKKLAEFGVEIFFTQVFRDSFFHADMHPGNLFIDITDPTSPKYLGVDFGIMGSLSPKDQHYLAENLLAFFKRDYKKVAQLHIASHWVPASTRVDHLEAAIRSVCEPIFERPICEVSFGQLLLKLLQTARQFKMEPQPQLMLLQKTLVGVEALGRVLYPQLNLWDTAYPFLEKWMRARKHPKNILKTIITQWQPTVEKLIETPHMAFDILQKMQSEGVFNQPVAEKQTNKKKSRAWLWLGAGMSLLSIGILQIYMPIHAQGGEVMAGLGVILILASLI